MKFSIQKPNEIKYCQAELGGVESTDALAPIEWKIVQWKYQTPVLEKEQGLATRWVVIQWRYMKKEIQYFKT